MNRIQSRSVALALGVAASAFGFTSSLCGQAASAQETAATPASAPAVAQNVPQALETASGLSVHSEKPALVVMGFESGTVSAQVQDKSGFSAILAAMRGGGSRGSREKYDPSELGTGIADMLIEKLLESGQFRLLERKAGESPVGAQYIVTGSVTKFGFEERNVGGLVATVATMGLLSYKQHKTEVTLTARVINAANGEIVASMSGDGVSSKGGGLRVAGVGGNGGGGTSINSSNFRATAIGQATERAVARLAEKIAQKKSSF